MVTDLEKKKQALAVTLTLTGKAKEAALGNTADRLNQDDGMDILIDTLDKLFLRENKDLAYESYMNFDYFKRKDDMNMSKYIIEFDQRYEKMKKYQMTLPDAVLAFKLLDNATLNHQQKQLALTACQDMKYATMRSALKRIFGESSNIECNLENEPITIKQESAFFTSKSRNHQKYYQKPSTSKMNYSTSKQPKGTNPLDKFGRRTKCIICESVFHWAKDCQHNRSANVQMSKDFQVNEDDECNLTLFTNAKSDNEIFMTESFGCAVIDTACTRTVCGKKWLENYMNNLDSKESKNITTTSSNRGFKFGDGAQVKSTQNVVIPAKIGETCCKIATEVVDVDIPLLLSKESLKRAGTILDLNKDKAIMFAKPVNLNFTSSGHYCIDICKDQNSYQDCMESVLKLDEIENMNYDEKKKTLLKLHRQFGHASADKLKKLLQSSDVDTSKFNKTIIEITNSCDTCIKLKRSPHKPAVGFPLATEFNETVAVDLHELEKSKTWYLHIIDEFTRFSAGAIIHSKKATVFVKKFIQCWISVFGAPRKLFSDNGGEFNNNEVHDMCENFNIEIKTTAAYSPWSNGLLERHNYTLTEMMLKIKADRQCDWETTLNWALMAKNCLSNTHGYSAYQLVFGRNPNLPSVLVDKIPALEGKTTSQVVAHHINALYAARQAFTVSESSERIRRALKRNVRTSTESEIGDKVYYKRPDSPEWKGPGIVIGIDGVINFIRHGGIIVRVHKCRLQKIQSERNKMDQNSEFIDDENDHNINNHNENTENGATPPTGSNENENTENEATPPTGSNENENIENEATPPTGSIKNYEMNITKIKAGQVISYKHNEDNRDVSAAVLGRAGKATGKHKTWFNLEYLTPQEITGVQQSVDLQQVQDLKLYEMNHTNDDENVLMFEDVNMEGAKAIELNNWKQNKVYEEVENHGQKCISTRWVYTLKSTAEGIEPKARLVARGYEEYNNDIQTDSPTCAHESLRVIISVLANRSWKIHSMDIKTAFLQGENMERNVYIKPPKEAKCNDKIWRLNKCVYGLTDASLSWYKRVKSVLTECGGVMSKVDPSVFYWTDSTGEVCGILACHVDDFIWGGTDKFENEVISKIRSVFKVGKESTETFQFCGIDLFSDGESTYMSQDKYAESLKTIQLNEVRLTEKDSDLTEEEMHSLRSKIGQLLWIAHQSRPDLRYISCNKRQTKQNQRHTNGEQNHCQSKIIENVYEISKTWRL